MHENRGEKKERENPFDPQAVNHVVGVNWVKATSSAGFTPRRGHTSVVFNNKIWVI